MQTGLVNVRRLEPGAKARTESCPTSPVACERAGLTRQRTARVGRRRPWTAQWNPIEGEAIEAAAPALCASDGNIRDKASIRRRTRICATQSMIQSHEAFKLLAVRLDEVDVPVVEVRAVLWR
jgi:hypothetical protein